MLVHISISRSPLLRDSCIRPERCSLILQIPGWAGFESYDQQGSQEKLAPSWWCESRFKGRYAGSKSLWKWNIWFRRPFFGAILDSYQASQILGQLRWSGWFAGQVPCNPAMVCLKSIHASKRSVQRKHIQDSSIHCHHREMFEKGWIEVKKSLRASKNVFV